MFRLWAVARHTLRQCLRMKVAVMFMALLAIALVCMPFLKVLKGDGTLAGQIQTFLIYSSGITAALLSLMTIVLSTAILSGDVRTKQIFSVSTKPVAPWQYIVGRWLGIFLLDVILVSLAGLAIYGAAQYLRTGEALQTASGRAEDRRKVETEVFAARLRAEPDQKLDIEQAVQDRIAGLQEQGQYGNILQAFVDANRGDQEEGYQHLLRHLTNQELNKVQSAGPKGMIAWSFSGIEVAGTETRAAGSVLRVSRPAHAFEISANRQFIGKLTYEGPVRVNGVDGRVTRINPDSFVVRFGEEEMLIDTIEALKKGKETDLVADPTIQITYKAKVASTPVGGAIASFWEIENPTDNTLYYQRRNDAVDIPATLTLPARVVDEQGRTVVRYVNIAEGANTVTIRQDDVAVLYRVGDFGPNFARAMGLILAQMAFLAALGVMAGALVSFPVACMFCFSMLPLQIARSFILDAVMPLAARHRTGLIHHINHYIVQGINKLLPDFGSTFPGTSLVDGTYIPWEFLGQVVFWTLCVQSAVLLVLACLVFRKRELARVQV